jgi:glucose/arabinose dehydrogenase
MDDGNVRMMRLLVAVAAVALLAAAMWARAAAAATQLPSGFDEADIATGFDQPVAVAWTPDGRMSVAEREGRVATLRLSRTFAGRRLRAGRHRLTLVATDAAGNRSRAVRATFAVRG